MYRTVVIRLIQQPIKASSAKDRKSVFLTLPNVDYLLPRKLDMIVLM